MGILPSDTLLIHSSMKSIGSVPGGADEVLDALMAYFEQVGMLLFPTLSYSLVNTEHPVFDVRNTKAVTGILPELFRQRPGVFRQLHPTHSISAYGKNAAAFVATKSVPSTPVPEDSPWKKLVDAKGKVLFLGVGGVHCNTLLHGVEEWNHATSVYTEAKQPLELIDYDGTRIPCPMSRHTGEHSRFYNRIEPVFRKHGILTEGKFGAADCLLLDAAKAAEITGAILAQYPAAFTEGWNTQNPQFWASLI